MGARRRRLSSTCMSAQLSLPPDKPTMTRSPSSRRLKSVIAFVVFFEILASSGLRWDIASVYPGRKRMRLLCLALEDFGNLVNRSEEHTSELQSQSNLVCRLLLEKK